MRWQGGAANDPYSFPFGCGANVLESTVVAFAYASSLQTSISYTPWRDALYAVPMMLSRDSWPQPQSLYKVPRNDVRATMDAAWKATGVWKQKCLDIKNEHFAIHKEKLQVIELSCFNQHRHQTSWFLKRLPPKVKFQDSLKGTPSSLPSAPSSPLSIWTIYILCIHYLHSQFHFCLES